MPSTCNSQDRLVALSGGLSGVLWPVNLHHAKPTHDLLKESERERDAGDHSRKSRRCILTEEMSQPAAVRQRTVPWGKPLTVTGPSLTQHAGGDF